MILVSACLLGINSKYDGTNNYLEKLDEYLKGEEFIFMCPEQLGGLCTPRNPSEIKYVDGKRKVYTNDGVDVTENFEKGAQEVLNICKKYNIEKAILKSGSPSCGYGKVYDGTFSGNKIDGNGITTELLLENGIEVISSKEFEN